VSFFLNDTRDHFSQFPRRDAFVSSKCDRTLPAARLDDVVFLCGKPDHEYQTKGFVQALKKYWKFLG
jgi:hypothetical protein